MSTGNLTLGVFGFGCVGAGLYETIENSGFNGANIKRICIRNPDKLRSAPKELFTTDARLILDDPEIDVIIELIDDSVAAYEIVTGALKSGKAVVTANKKLLAENFAELIQLQRDYNVPLLYEAACAASIPIIRNLEEYYSNDLVTHIRGILNGSTNFILSSMEEGRSFQESLELAQRLGFAETDPTLDVDGWDAKYKLTLLLAHAFGVVVHPDRIPHIGISNITPEVQKVASERRQRIKLIAKCWREENRICALVIPTFVEASDELFSVELELNGVLVQGEFSDHQFFKGKGAGGVPTAAAVLSDISALSSRYKYLYKKLDHSGKSFQFDEDFSLCVHLNGPDAEQLPLNAFERVIGTYKSSTVGYVEGEISIKNLIRELESKRWSVVALPTHAGDAHMSQQNELELANG